jgi:hypothetical protein
MTYNYSAAALAQQMFQWQPPDPQPAQPANYDSNPIGATPHTPPIVFPPGGNAPGGVTKFGAIPVYLVPPTTTGGITPQAGVASVVAVGGQSVVAIVGPCNGGQVFNGNTASQGVTAESLNADFTGPCLAGDANARGSTFQIATSTTYTLPGPLAPGQQLWINAITSNHHFSVFTW